MTIGRSIPAAIAVFMMALVAVPRATFAQKLSDAELKKISATATTPADHKKLAAHYRAHAAEHEADAKLPRRSSLSSGSRIRLPVMHGSWRAAPLTTPSIHARRQKR